MQDIVLQALCGRVTFPKVTLLSVTAWLFCMLPILLNLALATAVLRDRKRKNIDVYLPKVELDDLFSHKLRQKLQ